MKRTTTRDWIELLAPAAALGALIGVGLAHFVVNPLVGSGSQAVPYALTIALVVAICVTAWAWVIRRWFNAIQRRNDEYFNEVMCCAEKIARLTTDEARSLANRILADQRDSFTTTPPGSENESELDFPGADFFADFGSITFETEVFGAMRPRTDRSNPDVRFGVPIIWDEDDRWATVRLTDGLVNVPALPESNEPFCLQHRTLWHWFVHEMLTIDWLPEVAADLDRLAISDRE